MSMGTLFFISKLKFSYDKYSVDKVWTKIYCNLYLRGITLASNELLVISEGYHKLIYNVYTYYFSSFFGGGALYCTALH